MSTLSTAAADAMMDVDTSAQGSSRLEAPSDLTPSSTTAVVPRESNTSDLASSIWTIVVGSSTKAKPFFAHEDVLKKIPYFERSLAGHFIEATTRQLTLPEDEPNAFAQVMEFAYRGKCSIPASRKIPRAHEQVGQASGSMLLLRTYVLADKLCMEEFANSLIDIYKEGRIEVYVAGAHLRYLADHGPLNCRLLDFMLEQVAYKTRRYGWAGIKERYADVFEQFLDVSADNSQALLEKSFTMPLDAKNPAACSSNCRWHTHLLTPECEDAASNSPGDLSGNKRRRTAS